ncbi:hypothetical protein CsatB_011082 [Cannabis sativa]
MGLKSLANKAKGKCPIIEEEDSDFAPPLTKRGRAPPKKKTKVGVQEKMVEDVYGKNNNVGAAVRTEVANELKFSNFILESDCSKAVDLSNGQLNML